MTWVGGVVELVTERYGLTVSGEGCISHRDGQTAQVVPSRPGKERERKMGQVVIVYNRVAQLMVRNLVALCTLRRT